MKGKELNTLDMDPIYMTGFHNGLLYLVREKIEKEIVPQIEIEKNKTKIEIALALIQRGKNFHFVSEVTRLSFEEIKKCYKIFYNQTMTI
jgi:hypothetical protein